MTETRSMHPLRWLVVGLCGLALVFDGYDLVVYGTTVAALRREWGSPAPRRASSRACRSSACWSARSASAR
ncbi:hypothetical protein [Barrientosiimonas endolithica]|uniref:Major facilitator superfamily (MFS) profile domain-containing protein n=1 Tax=Barrientosiimonas endolithica TaxID=1535208 RepID=A0ABM8HDC4_9MICO|nr:hypothetical protein [Barrientosiimonas endolithica]BDZ58965.1 hypothetical protein GCM10025872_26220 [Barrientosiimonas endolithica]